MSEKEQPPIMDQKLCVNGCGFFGSSNTSHMCSKCWKDSMSQTMRDAEGKKDGVSSVPLPSLSKVSSMEDVSSAGGVVGMGLNLGLHVGNKENDSSNNLLNLQQQQAPPASPLAPTPPTPPSAAATAETTAAAPVAAPELPSPASSSSPLESATNADPAPMSPKPSAVVEAAAAAVAATAAAAGAEPALPLSPGYFGAGARGAGPAVGGGVGVDGGTAAAGVAVAAVAAAAADTPPARPEQKNRKRCFTCSKKVGYTGIACRCNYVFCSLHRYPEQHGCTFDFKTSDRNDLKRTVIGGGQFSKVDRL